MPYFLSSASHPASAPGTVTLSAPRCMRVRPRFTSSSRVINVPARPLALSATSFFSFALQMSANMSPPRPVIIGSTTASTAAAVTAASIALPPCCSTLIAAVVASGWLVAATPFGAYTGDLPAMVAARCAKDAAGTVADADNRSAAHGRAKAHHRSSPDHEVSCDSRATGPAGAAVDMK